MVYDMIDRRSGVSSLIQLYPTRFTYHIESLYYIKGKKAWYYWMYN
jgi:hypothetical protein